MYPYIQDIWSHRHIYGWCTVDYYIYTEDTKDIVYIDIKDWDIIYIYI